MGEQHFVGRSAVFMPQVALALDQAPRRGCAKDGAGLSGVRMIGYFIDAAKSTSVFNYSSKGIECDAHFE